jgi:S-adenosylmethionine/arginine decarboxylase-like enzyme
MTGGDITAHVMEFDKDLSPSQIGNFSMVLHKELAARGWVQSSQLCIYTFIRYGPKATTNVCICDNAEKAERLSHIIRNEFETNRVVSELLMRSARQLTRTFVLTLSGENGKQLCASAHIGPVRISHLVNFLPLRPA